MRRKTVKTEKLKIIVTYPRKASETIAYRMKMFNCFAPFSLVRNCQCYDPAAHPDVASGRMSPDEAFDDLSSSLCHQDADGPSEVQSSLYWRSPALVPLKTLGTHGNTQQW